MRAQAPIDEQHRMRMGSMRMGRMRMVVAIALMIWLGCVSAGRSGEPAAARPIAVPVVGDAFHAKFQGFAAGEPWRIVFQVGDQTLGDQTRRLPASDLVYWGSFSDEARHAQVVMADGSILAADFLSLDTDRLLVYSNLFGQVAMRLGQVRGVILNPPLNPLKRDLLLHKVQQASRGADRLLLDNGDVIHGVLGRPRDTEEAKSVPPEDNVWITMPNRSPTPVPLVRVTALVFNPALIEEPRVRGLTVDVGLNDGSLLRVERAKQEEGWLRLTTAGRIALECDVESALDEITFLHAKTQRVTYLSDTKPLGYKHIPFLELPWKYGTDRNVLGGRLRSGGRIWTKGLGMHSTSRLAYSLNGEAKRFEAEVALDDHAGRRGSVVFRVFLLDANGWRTAFESPVVRGGDKPLVVSVALADARGLALIVDFADWGDQMDHANWLNARLID